MKLRRAKAFTLIELLLVIAIIVVLAALIIPGIIIEPHHGPTSRMSCMNNQKQIALGLYVWMSDNDNKLPWQVSTNDGGAEELISNGQAVSQFEPVTSVLKSPQVFVCPSDKVKSMAPDTGSLTKSNISYFVNVDTTMTNGATNILTGDRHLQVANNPVRHGLFVYTNGMRMDWTDELHRQVNFSRLGVIAFSDCHVESVTVHKNELTDLFNRQNVASERLLVP